MATLKAGSSPQEDLDQGDPLSPYLFILYVEALSYLLLKAESSVSITSVPIEKGHVRINHLFFIDDSLLFCKANYLEWSSLIHLLGIYEKIYGQVLNKEKISIFFLVLILPKIFSIISSKWLELRPLVHLKNTLAY